MEFKLHAPYAPTGDQPQAIETLTEGVRDGIRTQVLIGVTGSGKTFTMANVIKNVNRPTLVIAHNKTLAAQLCNEFREFFPENRVEYFVSYYDYYQPESYVPSTDTYIEKDLSMNDEIDKLRNSATCALMERKDVIVVASVSCIYGLGAPEEYFRLSISLRPGMEYPRDALMRKLVELQYARSDADFRRSTFRVRGDTLEIFPASASEIAIRVEYFGDEIDKIYEVEALTGNRVNELSHAAIFPASQYAVGTEKLRGALSMIEEDLQGEVKAFQDEGKILEAQRLKQRTEHDLEMMREIGYCSGIENYSRYFDGRKPGDAPYSLLDYFPKGFLCFIDESHVTVPQIRAMYNGDRARKEQLVEYGFRLPSAFDNRPLLFEEFEQRIGQTIFVSATPGPYEISHASQIVEQIIRPTGLLDPKIILRKATGQVDDLVGEIHQVVAKKQRVLVTTLTKRMAESLTEYLQSMDIRVRYLHSDVTTMDRMALIRGLRLGEYDVLVGINLLREGLDLPEVSLVAILDADKEGFLRSETSLVQTIGRAARNVDGRVIMYADVMTDSLMRAISETNRRRAIQEEYNRVHGITPESVRNAVHQVLEITKKAEESAPAAMSEDERNALMKQVEDQMLSAAKALDFEQAAKLRDQLLELKGEKPQAEQIQKKRRRTRESTRHH